MLTFMCIGAQKSGTTWLYEQLNRIEQVGFPGGKEVHYWNARHVSEPLEWYQSLFSTDATRIEGDMTPAYAMLCDAAVKQIQQLYPKLKIIFILRNPIERAWSSALMALKRAELEIDEVSDQWFIDHFNSRGSRARGAYESTLRRWRGIFGEEAVKTLFYQDIQRHPYLVLQDVCDFLQLDLPVKAESQVQERVFAGPGYPLRESLKPVLWALYREPVQSLQLYLQKDLSEWLSGYGPRSV